VRRRVGGGANSNVGFATRQVETFRTDNEFICDCGVELGKGRQIAGQIFIGQIVVLRLVYDN
jgi:hypothetical protein